jgi:DNA-binding MarR family transcriptional regulator
LNIEVALAPESPPAADTHERLLERTADGRFYFAQLPEPMMYDERLNGPHFRVAMYVHRRGPSGCWASSTTIGNELGIHPKTVQRALRQLVAWGHLRVVPGRRKTPIFRVIDRPLVDVQKRAIAEPIVPESGADSLPPLEPTRSPNQSTQPEPRNVSTTSLASTSVDADTRDTRRALGHINDLRRSLRPELAQSV